MADETSPPPAAEAPRPARVLPRGRVPVTQPSHTAGFPITSGRRLPPGIPADLAGAVVTEGQTPAVPPVRNPMFQPLPASVNTVRNAASHLRQQLIGAAGQGERTLAAIEQVLKLGTEESAKAQLAAEGIDLDHLTKFRDAIAAALALTK